MRHAQGDADPCALERLFDDAVTAAVGNEDVRRFQETASGSGI
jgi:hypothetical protein